MMFCHRTGKNYRTIAWISIKLRTYPPVQWLVEVQQMITNMSYGGVIRLKRDIEFAWLEMQKE